MRFDNRSLASLGTLLALAMTAATGCGWNNLPHQGTVWVDQPLWDARGVVATETGLYAPLPHTGHLAYVPISGDPELVDLSPASLARLTVTPDGSSAVAFLERFVCHPDDTPPRQIRVPEDCPDGNLEVRTELAVISDGDVDTQIDVPGHFNAVTFSDDGAFAIAYLDFSEGVELEGVISLTSVLVLDLESGEAAQVAVGFAANRVLFTEDGTRAVVLSQSEVAVLDLTTSPPEREVTFPLTLDPDHVVEPVGVALTPDGQYALISVQGSGDLYILDLEDHAVNLVSLIANPAAMAVDATTDQTVLTYGSAAQVEVMEHTYFDTELIALDEPMNRIINSEGLAVLWNRGSGRDVYRLDLDTLDLVEYRLQNAATQVHLAPTREFAIALTQGEGMEILDLREGEDDTFPYLLEGQGVGAAFVAGEASLTALVLQEGVDYLYLLDLYTQQPEPVVDFSAPPIAIGTVPDGGFFITHDSGLGLVSFLDPASGDFTEVSGFATLGFLDGPQVLIEEE
ncbi:MAG: hypothetical protein JRJ84_04925 [Deltaproteobacteria bacterium]|nr:hypothetical protein [Deltaproteobacteria bacterium]